MNLNLNPGAGRRLLTASVGGLLREVSQLVDEQRIARRAYADGQRALAERVDDLLRRCKLAGEPSLLAAELDALIVDAVKAGFALPPLTTGESAEAFVADVLDRG